VGLSTDCAHETRRDFNSTPIDNELKVKEKKDLLSYPQG